MCAGILSFFPMVYDFDSSCIQIPLILYSTINRKALEILEKEVTKDENKDTLLSSMDDIPRVTVQHIVQATTNAMESAAVRKIQSLPFQHQLILCVVASCQTEECPQPTYAKVNIFFSELSCQVDSNHGTHLLS